MTQPSPARGALLAVAGACLWGTTGTSQALLVGRHSPLAVGGLRATIAAAALLAVCLVHSPRGLLVVARPGRRRWLLLGGFGVAGYQLTFFAAVARAGVGVGTLVMLATAPAVAGLAGWLLHGLSPSRLWAVATLVGLSGAALLVLASTGPHPLDWPGLLLAVAAGACFALYSVAGRAAAEGADPTALTAGIFLVAAVLLAPVLSAQDLTFTTRPRSLLVLGWLGLAATAGAYLLYQQGMRHVDAATAATLALAEPMVANLLAVVVLHERFTLTMGAGVALVLASMVLLSRA